MLSLALKHVGHTILVRDLQLNVIGVHPKPHLSSQHFHQHPPQDLWSAPHLQSKSMLLLEMWPLFFLIQVFSSNSFLKIFPVNPDAFSVVALSILPAGFAIKFTDNAWTGSALLTNEGTLQFLTSTVVPAGTVWSYDGAVMTNTYGTWSKIQVTSSLP